MKTQNLTAHENLIERGSDENDQINHDHDKEQLGTFLSCGYFIPSAESYI
jgi:hypothetical protein